MESMKQRDNQFGQNFGVMATYPFKRLSVESENAANYLPGLILKLIDIS